MATTLQTINDNVLAYPEVFEIQKTVKAGLAAPLVKSIRPIKVAYDYNGKTMSLKAGDLIFVTDEYLRKSQNVVKLVKDGVTEDLLLVKESDIIAIKKG